MTGREAVRRRERQQLSDARLLPSREQVYKSRFQNGSDHYDQALNDMDAQWRARF